MVAARPLPQHDYRPGSVPAPQPGPRRTRRRDAAPANPARRRDAGSGKAVRREHLRPAKPARQRDAGRGKAVRRQAARRGQALGRRSLASVGFVLTLGVVAALLFGLGVRYASLSTTGRQLVSLKENLALLEEEKAHLTAEISSLAAPDRVEGGARQSLGMTLPEEIRNVQVAALQSTPLAPVAGTTAVVHLPQAVASEVAAVAAGDEAAAGGWFEQAADSFYQWLAGASVAAHSRY